jgi:hypothetical protein
MSENTKGSRKAPRKHQSHWKDTTVAKRQSKRREQLDLKAVAAGYLSWSAYETAVINGETRLTPHEG